MNIEDYDYYARRACQEDEAASNSACNAARERHQELANAYRLRCGLMLGPNEPARSETVINHPMKIRQQIVSSRTAALAESPAAAPIPRCRA